jgi:hypothetical protein
MADSGAGKKGAASRGKEEAAPSRRRSHRFGGAGARPVNVTMVSLVFLTAPAVGAVLALLRMSRLTAGELALVFAAAAAHAVSGALMLKGRQSGRVVFWLAAPILIPIFAYLHGFDWVILATIGGMGVFLALLDTPATDRYFFGRFASMGEPEAGQGT